MDEPIILDDDEDNTLNDYDISALLDDYDILDEASVEASEIISANSNVVPTKISPQINNTSVKQKRLDVTTVDDQGKIDWRGLKLITYNGGNRPDYNNMEEDLNYSLRIEMVARNGNWRTLHPDLGIVSDDILMTMPMHPLHTYTACKQLIITAREDAMLYTQGIFVASGVLEKISAQFGYKMPEGFTEGNVLFASLFKRWAGNIAIDRAIAVGTSDGSGGRLLGSFSPQMQFGVIFIGSFSCYCALQWVLGDKAKLAYQTLSTFSHNDVAQVTGAATSGININPAPFSTGGLSTQLPGAGATDNLMGTLGKITGLMQLASQFMGDKSPEPTKERPREQRRKPTHRR